MDECFWNKIRIDIKLKIMDCNWNRHLTVSVIYHKFHQHRILGYSISEHTNIPKKKNSHIQKQELFVRFLFDKKICKAFSNIGHLEIIPAFQIKQTTLTFQYRNYSADFQLTSKTNTSSCDFLMEICQTIAFIVPLI